MKITLNISEHRTLSYVAPPQRGSEFENKPAAVRGVLESRVDGNAYTFLTAVGFELHFEYIRQGFCYHVNGYVRVCGERKSLTRKRSRKK